MPEVRDILDERLNVTIEPSPAVRSVLGNGCLGYTGSTQNG